jgi:hypothetical protein
MNVIQVLADNSFGDTRSGGLAGPTGLVIILLLAIGTVFLIRNMNSRLRKLPERFPAPPRRAPSAPAVPQAAPQSPATGVAATGDSAPPATGEAASGEETK